jgi:hypothetical protein
MVRPPENQSGRIRKKDYSFKPGIDGKKSGQLPGFFMALQKIMSKNLKTPQ